MYRKSIFNKPFIHITIPMAIGIVFYYYIAINIHFVVIGLLFLLLIYLFLMLNNRGTKYIIYFLFFTLGLLLMYGKTEKSMITPYIDKNVEVEGVITKLKESEGYSNVILKVEYISTEGVKKPIKEKMLVRIYGDLELDTGYEMKISGVIKEPNRNTNPKLFNYKLYLETNDIFTTINTRDYSVQIISKGNLGKGEVLRKKFRSSVEEAFSRYLDVEKCQLMTSIMLGDMTYLDENNQIKYRELGLAHLMAISGLHIGIISAFLISLFSLMRMNRKTNLLITISIMWFYGYLIGYPPSVLRALIMFTVLLYSQTINRPYDNINTLCFAAFVLLIFNPLWLFNIGFQLSFLATFSLITFSMILKNKFYPYNGKLSTSLYGILAVQIGIVPVLAYYFNSISLVSILANLILIPIMSLGVILGFILYLTSFLSNFLSVILGSVLSCLLSVEKIISNWIYLLPMGIIRVKSPDLLVTSLYYLIIFSLFDIIKIKNTSYFFKKTYFYSLAIFILVLSILPLTRNELELRFIDVGQGDSILIHSDGKNFLIDTGGNLFGNFDIGKNILVPYLIKDGVFSLDGVFITHFHEDHAKSLPFLMDNIKVRNLFIGYEREENKLYSDILVAAKKHGTPVYKIKYGDTMILRKDVFVKVLNPSDEIISTHRDNENNLSLVLMLDSFNYKTLFTGDIEAEIEKLLVEESEKVDFLKVPHHGSITSSTEDFIDGFSPEYGFNVIRTDESGLITLTITPNGYNINEFVQEKSTFKDIVLKYGLEINMLLLYTILWYIIISIDSYYYKELNIYDISRFYSEYQ